MTCYHSRVKEKLLSLRQRFIRIRFLFIDFRNKVHFQCISSKFESTFKNFRTKIWESCQHFLNLRNYFEKKWKFSWDFKFINFYDNFFIRFDKIFWISCNEKSLFEIKCNCFKKLLLKYYWAWTHSVKGNLIFLVSIISWSKKCKSHWDPV